LNEADGLHIQICTDYLAPMAQNSNFKQQAKRKQEHQTDYFSQT
jgi:hypothetical protein